MVLRMNNMKPDAKKGQIFRVKHGYNPNSSSMGSLIYALPVSMMAVTGGFALVSALILTAFVKKARKRDHHPEQAPRGAQADVPAEKPPLGETRE